MNAEYFIAKARTQLVLSHPFFGVLALHLRPEKSEEVQTAATDGRRLLYNPVWVETVAHTDGQDAIQGLIAHEVLHVALAHLWRRQKRERRRFNAACDLAINPLVREAGLPLPSGALLDPQFAGMTAEAIYARLSPEGGGDDGSVPSEQPWGDHHLWESASASAAQAEAAEREWRVRVAQAADAARKRGKLPASLERLVRAALYPKVDWRRALANFLQPTRSDYSFCPPDRRFLNGEYGGIALPDFAEASVEDVVIAVDTSASITKKVLSQVLAEVRAILETFPALRGHLVCCDAQVNEWHEIQAGEWPAVYCRGGGGTDFRPVFEEISRRGLSPLALVYLTDAKGRFPEQAPGYPCLWAVVNNPQASVPFGARVDIEVDDC